MNTTFFRLAYGEDLTFESLLHHLPNLIAKAAAGKPKSLLIATARLTPNDVTPEIALNVLYRHLGDLEQAVYSPLNKDETWSNRRKSIAADVLPWFANIHREDLIGVSFAQAATKAGFDPQLVRDLITTQLSTSANGLSDMVAKDFALALVLERVTNPAELYAETASILFTPAELAMARSAIEQAQAVIIGSNISATEALYNIKARLAARYAKAMMYGKTDPTRMADTLKDLTGIGQDLAA